MTHEPAADRHSRRLRIPFTRVRRITAYRAGIPESERIMIKWAIIFAIIGIIAGVLGFGGLAGASMGIAKFLFWAGIIIAVILFLVGMSIAKKV